MKRKITIVVLNLMLLSCSHHMIKEYSEVTDKNIIEIFRIFKSDTTKIIKYCHNNFLPARNTSSTFERAVWIDIEENTESKQVNLIFKHSYGKISLPVEFFIGDSIFNCIPVLNRQIIRVKKGKTRYSYSIYSYSSEELIKIFTELNLEENQEIGFQIVGAEPKDTIKIRPISGVQIRKEQYRSEKYSFDDYEKPAIKQSLELYYLLKKKHK